VIRIPKQKAVTIRNEGSRVLLIVEGRAVLDISWEAADQLARAIRAKARDAEEVAKADPIARDAAILLRAGVPVGLTSHPKIREEAGKRAAWDSDLRRYMPGGIRSTEMLGRPAVLLRPPKPPKER